MERSTQEVSRQEAHPDNMHCTEALAMRTYVCLGGLRSTLLYSLLYMFDHPNTLCLNDTSHYATVSPHHKQHGWIRK